MDPLWRNRDFMLLQTGRLLSQFGTQMSLLAYPLLVVFSPLRQPDRESTSHADFALDRDPSAQLFDETTDHVQAQTDTRRRFLIRRAALIKTFENVRQICGTDAAAIVVDIYAGFVGRGCYSQSNRAVVGRVLDRVFRKRANSSSQRPIIR